MERSVSIACMTTRELALKDFATEPEEARLRKAAHLMVASLAGSLALVTCKEPLRLSAAQQLRALLAQARAYERSTKSQLKNVIHLLLSASLHCRL